MLINTIAMLAGTNTASERPSKFVKLDALDVHHHVLIVHYHLAEVLFKQTWYIPRLY